MRYDVEDLYVVGGFYLHTSIRSDGEFLHELELWRMVEIRQFAHKEWNQICTMSFRDGVHNIIQIHITVMWNLQYYVKLSHRLD